MAGGAPGAPVAPARRGQAIVDFIKSKKFYISAIIVVVVIALIIGGFYLSRSLKGTAQMFDPAEIKKAVADGTSEGTQEIVSSLVKIEGRLGNIETKLGNIETKLDEALAAKPPAKVTPPTPPVVKPKVKIELSDGSVIEEEIPETGSRTVDTIDGPVRIYPGGKVIFEDSGKVVEPKAPPKQVEPKVTKPDEKVKVDEKPPVDQDQADLDALKKKYPVKSQ